MWYCLPNRRGGIFSTLVTSRSWTVKLCWFFSWVLEEERICQHGSDSSCALHISAFRMKALVFWSAKWTQAPLMFSSGCFCLAWLFILIVSLTPQSRWHVYPSVHISYPSHSLSRILLTQFHSAHTVPKISGRHRMPGQCTVFWLVWFFFRPDGFRHGCCKHPPPPTILLSCINTVFYILFLNLIFLSAQPLHLSRDTRYWTHRLLLLLPDEIKMFLLVPVQKKRKQIYKRELAVAQKEPRGIKLYVHRIVICKIQ